MLETSNLACKCTPICSFRKYSFQWLRFLNFADVSTFLQKISVFCPKKYLYSKQQCESCVRDFLVLFSVFVKQKVTITENITFADSVSGIRPPYCSKFTKKSEKGQLRQKFFDMTLTSTFFDVVLFLWSNLATGPTFMSISSLGFWDFLL